MKILDIIAICCPFLVVVVFTTLLAYSGKQTKRKRKETQSNKDKFKITKSYETI